MKLLLYIFAFVLLSGVAAFAQNDTTFTIRGKITQQWDDNPLYSGSIRLEGTTRGAYTDSLGNFTIKNVKPGNYKVKVSSLITEGLDTSLVVLNDNINSFNISIPVPDCALLSKFSKDGAMHDVASDSVTLLLVGSLAPIANDSQDYEFEKNYNLHYYDFGCGVPYSYCILEYNNTIFKHLDQKYGKNWRGEIRPDVIGFKEYISEN